VNGEDGDAGDEEGDNKESEKGGGGRDGIEWGRRQF
jgi:hypothetical protein